MAHLGSLAARIQEYSHMLAQPEENTGSSTDTPQAGVTWSPFKFTRDMKFLCSIDASELDVSTVTIDHMSERLHALEQAYAEKRAHASALIEEIREAWDAAKVTALHTARHQCDSTCVD